MPRKYGKEIQSFVETEHPLVLASGLCRNATLTRYTPGQVLWERNEEADHVVLVVRGLVAFCKTTIDGEMWVLDLSARGAVLGLTDVVEGLPHTCSVVSLGASTGLTIAACAVREAMRSGGVPAQAVCTLLARNIRFLGKRVADFCNGSVDVRVARALVRLVEEYGLPDARGYLVPLRLSRAQLASIVGCRVETLVRRLHAPEFSALLSESREGVVVHDIRALKELCL